jgi:hypothetical protein
MKNEDCHGVAVKRSLGWTILPVNVASSLAWASRCTKMSDFRLHCILNYAWASHLESCNEERRLVTPWRAGLFPLIPAFISNFALLHG